MASLDILCSDPLNVLDETTKNLKLAKQIKKNILWPIRNFLKYFMACLNISLIYFMAPAKTLRFTFLHT